MVIASTRSRADSDSRYRTVSSAAAVNSCGSAATSSASRYLFSIRCMKKFAATNVWRATPSRGVPNTRVIGTGSSTAGMWHD